jgi:hypothetical protein
VDQEARWKTDVEMAKSRPATMEELLRVEAVLSSMRARAGTVANPLVPDSVAQQAAPRSKWRDSVMQANKDLESSDEPDAEAPDLDEDAVRFFGLCPLLLYRKGQWKDTMLALLAKVRATRKLVKTWDIVRMNLAKKFLPTHLLACDPRLPPTIKIDGPMSLTKRYLTMLKRFAMKHEEGASSPKKRNTPTSMRVYRKKRSKRERLFDLVRRVRNFIARGWPNPEVLYSCFDLMGRVGIPSPLLMRKMKGKSKNVWNGSDKNCYQIRQRTLWTRTWWARLQGCKLRI